MVSEEHITQHVQDYFEQLQASQNDTLPAQIPIKLVSCSVEERTMTFSAQTSAKLQNLWGVTHGGMLATIFDTCMGNTIRGFRLLSIVRTVNLNVSYLRPVPVDAQLRIKVRLLTTGNTLATMDLTAWLPGEEERPTNLATGTFYISCPSQ